MKTLILFRHGKSDWDADHQDDHERPVAKRGKEAARYMGKFLRKTGINPDLVITSSAVRAQKTLELAANEGGWKVPVDVTDALYLTSPKEVLQTVSTVDDEVSILMLVGHEPTWSETVRVLTGGSTVVFPTAAMACLELDIEQWKDLAPGCGKLKWLVPPKILQ